MAGNLKLELAQYREVEGFTKLGLVLDDATKQLVEKGGRLTSLLIQKRYVPVPISLQILYLYASLNNYLNWLSVEYINLLQSEFVLWFTSSAFHKPISSMLMNMVFPEKIIKFFIWHFSVSLKIFIDTNY